MKNEQENVDRERFIQTCRQIAAILDRESLTRLTRELPTLARRAKFKVIRTGNGG